MKLFLSWSGDISKKVALIFYDWLPSVIQSIEPYISVEDIDKGARWSNSISSELEQSSFGIIFVTPDNIKAPWLNFEAGALSKAIDTSYVSPFLFGVKNSDLSGPLVQFQSTLFEKEEISKLLHSINKSCVDGQLTENRLNYVFEKWWPELESKLNDLEHQLPILEETKVHSEVSATSFGKSEVILEEILELSRNLQRTIKNPNELFPVEFFESIISSLNSRNERNVHLSDQLLTDLQSGLEQLNYLTGKEHIELSVVELNEVYQKLKRPINFLLRRSGSRLSVRELREVKGNM